MSTTETTQQTVNAENIPFTTPQAMRNFVTDTGKILPRKYTHLSAKQQRAITKTIKQSRNNLLALYATGKVFQQRPELIPPAFFMP